MDILLLKLLLTPALIGGVSLAGRRWGPEISGWLVGLPLTSGPVAFFLALSYGTHFASAASISIFAGTLSEVAFAFAYAWTLRYGWISALSAGCLSFIGATIVLNFVSLPPVFLVPVVIVALFIANNVFPTGSYGGKAPLQVPPDWDIPLRMLLTTLLVLLLTGIAPVLGSRLTGLISPFPLYAAIMVVFAHRLHGPAAAARVLNGLLLGLFAFAAFFLVLALTIEQFGILLAFAGAILVALATQGISFLILRDRRSKYESVER
jgi:hypothetical protein